jgi:sphingomyelin phosphodiesterase acid-like 3
MKKIGIILLLLGAMVNSLVAQVKAVQQGNIISVSDIHFNPYFDPSLVTKLVQSGYKQWPAIFASSAVKQPNTYNSDSNFPLFKSALAAMKQQNASPTFMVITGDFLCHSFQQNFSTNAPSYPDSLKSFTSKTIQFMAMMFNQYFPQTIVLPVLGNNDSYCGDYQVEADGAFLNMFAKAWAPLQRNHSATLDKAFITNFFKGGYYTYALRDGSGGKMVMLNTVFFSAKYTSCGVQTGNPAGTELQWLTGVLKQSQQQKSKLWLAMHIPPGIDVNSTLSHGSVTSMWADSCNTAFINLLTQYAPIIKAGFCGHTHMDDFRLLYNSVGTPISFFHITPAVSPLFDNNPGFQCISYSKAAFTLFNIKTYYLNVSTSGNPWALEYDYQKTYGITGINPASVDAVRKKISSNPTYRNYYINYYDVNNPASNGINQQNWMAYWCGTGNLTQPGFSACYSTTSK